MSLQSDVVDWREPLPEEAAIQAEHCEAINEFCDSLQGPIRRLARETYLSRISDTCSLDEPSRTHRANLKALSQRIAHVRLARFKEDV